MEYSAKTIANYFLNKSFQEGVPVSPMKLIKLVYLAHGWSLGFYEKPLIREAVQAWKYGPVIHSLYKEFKRFGNAPITELASQADSVDTDSAAFLDKVWKNYSRLSAVQLSNLTHQPDSPWCRIWHDELGKDQMGAIIPNELIRDYYKQKLDARG